MTPACGRCGSRSIAHVNGVGRQCLMCGEEHDEDGRDAALAMKVAAVVIQERRRDGGVMTARAAADATGIRYKLVLQWASKGELAATAWDPQLSRRGRQVWLADLKDLIKTKLTVECAWCGTVTVRDELPRGKARRFCPPPARCASLWHSHHRVRP